MRTRTILRVTAIAIITSFLTCGATIARSPGPHLSLSDKLRFGILGTIMLVEVGSTTDVVLDPVGMGCGATVNFKILETLKGKPVPFVRATVDTSSLSGPSVYTSGYEFLPDYQAKNVLRPGRRFILFLPDNYNSNECRAEIYEATEKFTAAARRNTVALGTRTNA